MNNIILRVLRVLNEGGGRYIALLENERYVRINHSTYIDMLKSKESWAYYDDIKEVATYVLDERRR